MKEHDKPIITEVSSFGLKILSTPRSHGGHGGLGVIYNPNLNLKLLGKYSSNLVKYKTFEYTEHILKSKQGLMRFCNIYRRPYSAKHRFTLSHFFPEFESYLEGLVSKPGTPILLGDFNIHLECIHELNRNKFLKLIEEFSFVQNMPIDVPTHRDGGVLDLILTSELISSDISNIQVYPEGTRSDHYMVSCKVKRNPEKIESTNSVKAYRNFRTINLDKFKLDLRASPLCIDSTDLPTDVDSLTGMYNEEIFKLMDNHCPIVYTNVKNFAKKKRDVWFDDELYILLRKCRAAERKWYKTRCLDDKTAYRNIEKQYSDLVKSKRQLHDSGIIIRNKNDKRKLFKKLNEMLGNEKRILPHSNNDKQLADDFSKFFDSKIKVIHSNIAAEKISDDRSHSDDCNDCNFINDTLTKFLPLTNTDLLKLLSSMNNKFCCLDPLPTWLLLECIDELLPFLLKIVNCSLESGVFPSNCKKAVIKPSIKDIKECPDSFPNFRPVSNISFLAKLCEKAVLSQLNEYLDQNKLLCSQQSGYRRFHSCETLNLKMCDDILKRLDEGSTVALLLLDLSAAFDTVDHQLLISLLESNYGIKGKALKWFENYLQGRSCAVNIADSFSDFICLLFGVPQGSILGPILFIMYTKHIQHIAKKYGLYIQLYADDTQLYIAFKQSSDSAESTKRDIENCITEIKKWMCLMSLKLNEGKTKLLFLNKPAVESTEISNFTVQTCGTNIVGIDWQKDKDIKSLGVFLDEHFTLSNHLSSVRKYCFGQLMSWKKIAPSLTEDVKLLLVKQIILSKIDYNNSLFAGLPDTFIQGLQSIVNCSIRFIYNLRKCDHITPYIIKSHILPVKYRINYKVCILVFNCLNNYAPDYLKDLLNWNIPSRPLLFNNGMNNNPPRRTQDPLLLDIPTDFGNKTRYRSRCFSHYAPRCWNNLPYKLRSYTNKDIFASNLKTYLFNLYVTDSNIHIVS